MRDCEIERRGLTQEERFAVKAICEELEKPHQQELTLTGDAFGVAVALLKEERPN